MSSKKSIIALLRYVMKQLLLKNRKRFLYYIIGAILASTTSVLGSLALTEGFSMIETKSNEELIIKAIKVLLFGFSPILIQLISRYMRIGFMRDVLIDVRALTYKKIMNIPIEEFRTKKREDYISMLASDINIFERDFFLSVLNIIYAFGSFIIGEMILFFVHPYIAIMVILASIVLFVVVKVFEKPTRTARKQNTEANAEYTSKASNLLNGMEVLKLYQVEENFKSPFYLIVNKLERVKQKSNMINALQWNISMWIAQVSQFAMYMMATYLYIEDRITLSGLILVFNFVGSMVWGSINGFNFVNRLKASVDIFNRITQGSSYDLGNHDFSLEKSVSIRNLSYSYGDFKVLNNLNLDINKGQKILIYGPSGTGKTTFANCISQNLSDYVGSITYDDIELRTIKKERFLKNTGYIRQHHFMFEDSIINNIVLDQPLDTAKVEDVLRKVDLLDWALSLPNGLDTKLENNGGNVSGGQRQRLSIAREIYRESKMLFVDEPSASLDDETSIKVYDTLFSLNQTVVIVSHRHLDYLSQRADGIVIFDEEGSYTYETK